RAGERFREGTGGQADRARLAHALIAALVAGDETERGLDAGPGMLGDVLVAFTDARARAGLRQRKREVRRPDERAAFGAAFVLRDLGVGELRLGGGHAVVVLDLVAERDGGAAHDLRV